MGFFKGSLSLQMLLATFLGIFCGIFFGELCNVFSPFASAYIMILRITAVPYLIVAIILGVGQLSGSQSISVLKKGFFFIFGAWAINVGMIFLIQFLFPSPKGNRITSYNPQEPPSINFSDLLIPENIFYDLANNIVPAIVMFCLLIGVALIHHKDKQNLLVGMDNILKLFSKITGWISRITPIGTFLILSNQFGSINLNTVKQVISYIILYIVGLSIIIFWIFPKVLSFLTGISALKWLKNLAPILLLAYTTNFVIVCLPFIIELLQRILKEEYGEQSLKAQGEVQGLVSVIFNLPLGSLFIAVFILFLSIFYNAPLSLASTFEMIFTSFLTSLGAVGLGSWINSLSFLLDSLMLPQDAIQLYLTTLPFTSGFQSMVSVIEIASIAMLVVAACHKILVWKPKRVISGTLFTFGPVVLLAFGIKIVNPLPPIQSAAKTIYDLSIDSTIPVSIYEQPQAYNETTPYPSTLDRILATKTLRVGYTTHTAPFSFINAHRELAGFDIAFAHQLAFDLGCRLEFIPLDYSRITKQVNTDVFDIAMAAVTMNEKRIQDGFFSNPYISSPIIYVMTEEMKKNYNSSPLIFGDKSLRIAYVKGSAFSDVVKALFPEHPHVILDSYDQFAKPAIADVLVWDELEAIAWILKNRKFRILLPDPAIGQDTLSYLIKQGDLRFLEFINNWLTIKKNEGFYDHQYDLWVRGKTEKVELHERRWSVIRDVLHWVN